MSNHTLERQLDLLIRHLEELPKKICDEFESRSSLKREIQVKELQAEIDFHKKNIDEINKMISVYPEDDAE